MEIINKAWNDPVGSKVIAFVIIAILTQVFIFIWSLFADYSFYETYLNIIAWLKTSIDVPYWVIIVGIIFLILAWQVLRKGQISQYDGGHTSTASDSGNSVNSNGSSKFDELAEFTNADDLNNSDPINTPENMLPNDVVEDNIIKRAPTVFFDDRICTAFPGVESYKWIEDSSVAINRLEKLLKDPIFFDESRGYGVTKDPVWWFRDSSAMHIHSFRRLSDTHCLMNNEVLNIDRIAVVRSGTYYQDFVYVETSADPPVGIYQYEERIEYYAKHFGYYAEEYGLLDDKPITRASYDDGAAEIDGVIVDATGAVLRRRYLTPYNLVIAAKFSPYNSRGFCLNSKEILNGILKGTNSFDELLKFMGSLPKNRHDD